jgi:hypothetical protein
LEFFRGTTNCLLLEKVKNWSGLMKFATMALAATFVIASAAFTASYAQTAAVSDRTFDWIFFVIVGIPFILGLVQVFKPDILERFIRDRNTPVTWDTGRQSTHERPDRTPPL